MRHKLINNGLQIILQLSFLINFIAFLLQVEDVEDETFWGRQLGASGKGKGKVSYCSVAKIMQCV